MSSSEKDRICDGLNFQLTLDEFNQQRNKSTTLKRIATSEGQRFGENSEDEDINAAFNDAKGLVSNLNILNALKKHTAFELHDLNKNIFDSVRLKINSDNYSIAHSDSSSNSESDYNDETIEDNEINNDLFNFNEEDQDVTNI
ncbi:unnamed protein product [Rotaria sordida]|uniref:Uncharacterized protein n=1 Tax=Rotaria sordida TaxID=392033 RepID=A0A814GWC3_9BILA|nr:unnamed protein product [Rotaria sordida]